MQNGIKKFFTKESVLIIFTVTAAVCYAANVVAKVLLEQTPAAIEVGLLILCLVIITAAYFKHEKNIMKFMLGAAFIWFLKDEISYLGNVVIPDANSGGEYATASGSVYIIMELVIIAMFLAMFLNHIIMISDHGSNPELVSFNLIIVALTAILSAAQTFATLSVVKYETVNMIEIISWQVALIAFLCIIVCIEAKIDVFKTIRESKQEETEEKQ